MSADADPDRGPTPAGTSAGFEDGTSSADPGAPARRRRVGVFGVVAVLALAADVVSKVLIVAQLRPDETYRALGGAFYLDIARNSGAAFSFGTGFTIVLTLVALAVVVVIVRIARKLTSIGWAVSLGLILGGALGNLSDRLFRAPGVGRGHVVDWISLFGPWGEHWPIFNVADSAIVIGAILAALLAMLGVDISGRKARRA